MHMGTTLSTLGQFIIALGLISPVTFFAYQQNRRPPRQAVSQPLFQGIHYQRLTVTDPRPNILHIVTIDLSTPGIQPLVSMPTSTVTGQHDDTTHPGKIAINAQTTSEFVDRTGVQIGINGNYFYEFREKTPWDFYPHSGDPVYAVGEAIGAGDRYGSPRNAWPALCFSVPSDPENTTPHPQHSSAGLYRAHIFPDGHCPPQTDYGIAGRDLLFENGHPLTEFPNVTKDKAYSRAAVGIDQSGQTLWLVMVDGKQPLYSEGLLLSELADVFVDFGVHAAIALDGGGSSTLVVKSGARPQPLNTPMHVKWPHQERPIANHLGFYALPSLQGDMVQISPL